MKSFRNILILMVLATMAFLCNQQEQDIISLRHRVFNLEGGLMKTYGGLVFLNRRISQLAGGSAPTDGGLAPSSFDGGLDLEYARAASVALKVREYPMWKAGAGVFVSDNIILTAKHVLEGRGSLSDVHPFTFDGRSYTVLEILEDSDDDLALVIVDRVSGPKLRMGVWPLLGDKIISIGFPMGNAGELSVFWGYVSNENYRGNKFMFHGFSRPGCSGGPVIVNGRLAGICIQYFEGCDSLGFAAPLERLDSELLARIP
jgi:S1-C subfamily serine protease